MAGRLRYEDYSLAHQRVSELVYRKQQELDSATDPQKKLILKQELGKLIIQRDCAVAGMIGLSVPPRIEENDSDDDFKREMRRRIDALMNVGETR